MSEIPQEERVSYPVLDLDHLRRYEGELDTMRAALVKRRADAQYSMTRVVVDQQAREDLTERQLIKLSRLGIVRSARMTGDVDWRHVNDLNEQIDALDAMLALVHHLIFRAEEVLA